MMNSAGVRTIVVALGAAALRWFIQDWQSEVKRNGGEHLNEFMMHTLPTFVLALVCCYTMIHIYGKRAFKGTLVALLAGAFLGEAATLGYYLLVTRWGMIYPIDVTFGVIGMVGGVTFSFATIALGCMLAELLPYRSSR